jgi:hypothetical protein
MFERALAIREKALGRAEEAKALRVRYGLGEPQASGN